jgi:hypothetical protein
MIELIGGVYASVERAFRAIALWSKLKFIARRTLGLMSLYSLIVGGAAGAVPGAAVGGASGSLGGGGGVAAGGTVGGLAGTVIGVIVGYLFRKFLKGLALRGFEIFTLVVLLLESILPTILDALSLAARETTAFYARDFIYEAVGAKEIGSHSLLSKDLDDSDPFADHAFRLAHTVHRYVVHVMVRNDLDSARRTRQRRYIDWDNLLGYFLRHPLGQAQSARTWWRPVFEPDPSRPFSPPLELGHRIRLINTRRQEQLIRSAANKRIAAEQAYRRR